MTPPAYQRIKDYLLDGIQAGEWAEGDRVPSEPALARRFGVARMTANRAVRELSAERVLTRAQGAGTFVARPPARSTLVEIRSIAAEIAARGHRHDTEVLALERAVPTPALAAELGLRRGAGAFHSLLLHREEGVAVQLEDRWVRPAAAPGYLRQDFRRTTPNELLMRVAPLQKVEYRIEARHAPAPLAAHLQLACGEPCLLLHRRTWSGGQAASVADLWHPGSRYRLTGHY